MTERLELKIPSTNQSLILAGEPGGSRGVPLGVQLGVPESLLGQASRLVAGGAALKRVTILQADYYSGGEGPVNALPANPGGSSNEAPAVANVTTLRVPATPGHSLTSPFYFNPIELYTRTQRGFDQGPKTALLDVHA